MSLNCECHPVPDLRSIRCVTSVPPKIRRQTPSGADVGGTYLQSCLENWLKTGAMIVTLNRLEEIPHLQHIPSGVKCLPLCADRALYTNRYGPSLGAMFEAAGDSDIVGIFNADTYLFDASVFLELLEVEAKNSLIFARRIDVEVFGGALRTLNKSGVDAIFFDREQFKPMFEAPEVKIFQMGVPWWDVLVPTVATFYGNVSCVAEPYIAHMDHQQAWDGKEYRRVGLLARDAIMYQAEKMADKSLAAREFLNLFSAFLERMKLEKDRKLLFLMNQFCWNWVWANTKIIQSPVKLESVLFKSSFKASIEERKFAKFRLDTLSSTSSFKDLITTFKADFSRTHYLLFRHLEQWIRYKVRPKYKKKNREQ